MSRRTSILLLGHLTALAALSATREANAQWDDCNGGYAYGGTCFYAVVTSGNYGIYSLSTGSIGVFGTDSTNGYGVEGSSANGYGVYGTISGTSWTDAVHGLVSFQGNGVAGINQGIAGNGVYGSSDAEYGYGIEGYNSAVFVHADSSRGSGVYGGSVNGYGVYGISTNADGVRGEVTSTTRSGVAGLNNSNSSGGPGVEGQSVSGVGVVGEGGVGRFTIPGLTYGVWGTSDSSDGVHGDVSGLASAVSGNNGFNGPGVSGTSNSGYGVYGTSGTGYGVYGTAPGTAMYGNSTASGGTGVLGTGYAYGVSGSTNSSTGYGIYGNNTSSFSGGLGVYGTSTNGDGVFGTSPRSGTHGVYGKATGSGGVGVYGNSTGGGGWGIVGGCSGGGGCYGIYSNQDVGLANGYSYYYNNRGTCVAGACAPSDARLKKNIEPLSGAIGKLLEIKGVTYRWKNSDEGDHPAGMHTGVIAQDVEKVFPEWVSETPEGVKVLNIDQRTLLGITVESFRTLKMENDMLAERLAALESGRQLRVSGINLNGVGFGVGGLAIAGGLVFLGMRRRRDEVRL